MATTLKPSEVSDILLSQLKDMNTGEQRAVLVAELPDAVR